MKKRGRRFSTTIYLDPDQMESLKRLQERRGIPMAHTIRRGLDLALKEAQAWADVENTVEDEIEKRAKLADAIKARRR